MTDHLTRTVPDPASPEGAATTATATTGTVRAALEHEHHAIDDGIECFLAGRDGLDHAETRLREALSALRRHIYLEEEFLFPPLRQSGMLAPIFVMLKEHRELWRIMDDLAAQVDGADHGIEKQRETASALLALLERHNTKEEPIIYGEADTVLSEAARCQLQDFIAHQELPSGWVCMGL